MAHEKTVVAADAQTALVDAMADMMHVHNGQIPVEVWAAAWGSATDHYEAERDGADGVFVKVVHDDR